MIFQCSRIRSSISSNEKTTTEVLMPRIFFYDHAGFCSLYSDIRNQPVCVITEKRVNRRLRGDNVFWHQTIERQRSNICFTAVACADVKLAHKINDLVPYNMLHNIDRGKIRLRLGLRFRRRQGGGS